MRLFETLVWVWLTINGFDMNTLVLTCFNGSPALPFTPALTLLDWDWEDFDLRQKLYEKVEERAIAKT